MEQKLLALKVLLESQSNNNSIGIDFDLLRKEVDALRNPPTPPTPGEMAFDPTKLAGSPTKKKKQSKRNPSSQGENSIGSKKIVRALSK